MNSQELMRTPSGDFVPIEGKKDVLWRYDAKTFKVYTEDSYEKSRLGKIVGVEISDRYFFKENDAWKRGWDFLVPYKRAKSVCRILSGDGRQKHKNDKTRGGDDCGE